MDAIEKALSTGTDSITAIALWPLFKGKSVNTPAFLLAVLTAEGIVQGKEGKKRTQVLGDLDAFKANVKKLYDSGVSLPVEAELQKPSRGKASAAVKSSSNKAKRPQANTKKAS